MHILVVDDEERIASFLSKALRAEGYTTRIAFNGNDALRLLRKSEFDLVILDILMPGKSGFTVLEEIRFRHSGTPVLVLTAKDDLTSKVRGLNLGADDYMTKPFALEELIARVRAITRRHEQSNPTSLKVGTRAILDLLSRELCCENQTVPLSTKEFALLEYLLLHPNQVLSREQILNQVWGYEFDPGSNVVDVYVRYLRQKLDKIGEPSIIETVRGTGYRAVVK